MRKTRTIQKVQFLAPDVITKIIPAPTDGWDAISPLAEMDPKRAPILINWVPRPGYVELRGGFLSFNTVGAIPVQTLMTYRPSLGAEKLFAAAGTEIRDVSIGGTSTIVQSGLNSSRWQYTNFGTVAGHFLFCVNGIDQMRQFNGTVWSTPAITGLPGGSTANIININSQKRRLWFIIKDSTIAAFMPTDAIAGAVAGTQDFGPLWTLGGHIVAMSAWTIDGGSGPQDYAVFLSSRGQVTIYSGVDPTNADDWKIVGTFNLAPPIGLRCMLRVGSDVAIITQQGVIPISQALPFDPSADRSVAITARIQNAMSQAAMQYQSNFGWQMLTYPNQQLAFLNVPISENNNQQQFVMNTLTGAWCQFIGWNANCFEVYNDNFYFGGNDGSVNQGYVGSSDGLNPIAADMQCAFNWLDEPGRTKRMTLIQPLLNLGAALTPTLSIDADFKTSVASAPLTPLSGGAAWDSAIWDTSTWPLLSINFTDWLTVNAIGHAMAVRMRVNVTGASSGTGGVFDSGTFDSAQFDTTASVVQSTTLPVLQVNAFNSISEMGGAL